MMTLFRIPILTMTFVFLLVSYHAVAFTPSPAAATTTTTTTVRRRRQQQQQQEKTNLIINNNNNNNNKSFFITKSSRRQKRKEEWIEKSIDYYSTVMRVQRRLNVEQISKSIVESEQYQNDFFILATKHYFALQKIKDGQNKHAEIIYRKIIDEIINNEEENDDETDCKYAKLAISTLLLALHLQRMNHNEKARTVFLDFFSIVINNNNENDDDDHNHHHTECACSAKVLGAFALFEMKHGNKIHALEIAQKAIKFDSSLEPILQWKQFREIVNEEE